MKTATATAAQTTGTKTVHAEVGKGVTGRRKGGKETPVQREVTQISARKGAVTEPREGSKRGELLGLLRKGPQTLSSIEKKFDWKPRDCMDAARLLAHVNGFAIKVADGKMSLVR